jgi:YihY family inner membrane protein
MKRVERALKQVDAYQQRHGWLGFPFAVVKKLGDDRGGALGALLAWNATFAIFPLLLVLITGLGYVLGRYPELQQRVLDSTLAEFPILGDQLRQNVRSLRANGFGLAVGLLGFLWGARGVGQAGQHAMAEVWNVPGRARPTFWTRQVRGLVLLVVFGLGVIASTALSWLLSFGQGTAAVTAANLLASAAVNGALFVLAFRVLTPALIPTRQLLLGGLLAGAVWSLLQVGGGYLVGHYLRNASQVYGLFAIVLGMLSWLLVGAQVTLFAAEVNVVRARRLWPRSLLQPPFTEPDQRHLVDLAKQEERHPQQQVEVSFTPEAGGERPPETLRGS